MNSASDADSDCQISPRPRTSCLRSSDGSEQQRNWLNRQWSAGENI